MEKVFISSEKLFSFSRYSIFCNFSTSFPQFQEFKELGETGIIMTS